MFALKPWRTGLLAGLLIGGRASVITELLYLHIRGYRITMSKITICTTRSTPAFVIREERILFFMILWLSYYDSFLTIYYQVTHH